MSGTSQVVLTLGVALIAAGAGVLGSTLGPNLGAKRAHEHWLRDKRAELFERYYAVLVEAMDESRAWGLTGEPGDYRVIAVEAEGISVRLRNAASALALYSSPALSKAALEASTRYYTSLVARIFPGDMDRRAQFARRFDEHAATVQAQLRAELGVR